MAKKKKASDNSQEDIKSWAVVHYPADNLASKCHISDVATDDERIEVISRHDSLEEAQEALDAFGKKNKTVNIQL